MSDGVACAEPAGAMAGIPSTDGVRILRVIARLNIGGPAIQAITLSRRLEERGYRTVLVRGSEGPAEGSMDYLADELGVRPRRISQLRRDPAPLGDPAALAQLVRIMRRVRPHIVHTHAAKAGTLGRAAALLAFPGRRPPLVHTFHGHSLTGYFAGPVQRGFLGVERGLAKRTTRLVAVSTEVRDELLGLGVGRPEQYRVIPLGFELSPFLADRDRPERRRSLRAQLGLASEAQVVTLVARLVPIKRVDRFLRVASLLADRPGVSFVVVGDGELAAELRGSAPARGLGDRLVWAGFRRDMADVCYASDVVVLTSDNEGTPVSLIEAQAAAVPVVSTDVGGVRSVIADGETGLLASVDDDAGLARAIASVLEDPDRAARLARAGREHAVAGFDLERLVADVDALYRDLLSLR